MNTEWNYTYEKDENISTKDTVKVKKHSLLSLALMWFGYFLLLTFGTGAIITWQAPNIFSFFLQEGKELTTMIISIVIGIFAIINIIIIGFFAYRLSFKSLIFWSTTYALYLGILVAPIIQYAINAPIYEIMGIMLIPSAAFITMGLLGYFHIINFGKIWPIILILSIGLLIVSLISIFLIGFKHQESRSLYIGISIGFYILMCLYTGLDFWIISSFDKKTSPYINSEVEQKELKRLGVLFGLRLAIDYIYCLIYAFRILHALKQ